MDTELQRLIDDLLAPLDTTPDGREAKRKLYDAAMAVIAALRSMDVDWAGRAMRIIPRLLAYRVRNYG